MRSTDRNAPTVGALALVLLLALSIACAPAGPGEGGGTVGSDGDDATAQTPIPEAAPVPPFAAAVEAAHGAEAWRSQRAFATDLLLVYGGQTALQGSMLMTPDAAKTRFERPDGAVLVFDGEAAWVAPGDAEWPMARFHALTWPYFAAVPYKLRDPGSHLEPLGELPLEGTPHPAAKLTFEPGVGDTPDDWYIVYRDPETDRVEALAYIVTYGTPAEEAEKEPHAIVYRDFVEVDGAQVPTRWELRHWNREEGVHGEPLGHAELTNPRFVEPGPDAFTAPQGAQEAKLPEDEGTAAEGA